MSGPGIDDDYDLKAAWSAVLDEFAKIAEVRLQPDKLLSAEEVIAQLQARQDKKEKDDAKYRVLKDVVGKSLKCIQTLGGIAAQGASMVFGPTNLCFNAISFLISAGQNYNKIFSDLEMLFKQVSDVLERFVVYLGMKEIDLPLRKIVHELLRSIISVCAVSTKVLHGNRFLKFAKVFALGEDDGVRGEMAKLRALVDREAQMKTTLTYKIATDTQTGVKDIQSSIKDFVSDSRKKELSGLEAKQLEKISEKLNVQKEFARQKDLYERVWAEAEKPTGEWLTNEDEDYKLWVDRSSLFSKTMLVSADQGYGKTFLLTSVIHQLRTLYHASTDDSARTVVAHYYLQPKDAKSGSALDDDFLSVEKVIKTLAFQLAKGDAVYRRYLASICEDWQEEKDATELFGTLFDFCYNGNEVFYFVVDGIDLASEKQLQSFSAMLANTGNRFTPQQQSHVRVLLGGKVNVISQLHTALGRSNVLIDVAARNRPDIQRFITSRLATTKLLQGTSEQVQQLRKEILDTLTQVTNGDFINVDLLLREIATKQWPTEIRQVLTNAKEKGDRADTISREVERCNETLSTQEIRDLNTLLTWVISAKRSMSAKELNAILALENGETSLRPLNEQIRDKYSAFLYLEEEDNLFGEEGFAVSLTSDSILKFFQARSNEAAEGAISTGVDKSEVKIVQRFLKTVCDDELFKKFGFESFFASKLQEDSATVQVDLENAASTLAGACLRIIIEQRSEIDDALGYAVESFCMHLADVDLSMTQPTIKTEIGKNLLRFLSDENSIHRFWWVAKEEIRSDWFYTGDSVNLVLAWFRDTAVIKSFSEEQKTWVKNLTSSTPVDNDLLEHTVKRFAFFEWQVEAWNQKALYSCMQAYKQKVEKRTNPAIELVTEELPNASVKSEGIIKLSEWAEKLLGVDGSTNYLWTKRTARLLREYGHVEAAIEKFKQAITLDADPWLAKTGLAMAYSLQERWQDAIDIVEAQNKDFASGASKEIHPGAQVRYNRGLLGKWYRKLNRFNEAIELYTQQIAESTISDYEFINAKIRTLHEKEAFVEVRAFLQELQTQQDVHFGITRLSRFMHTMVPNEEEEINTLDMIVDKLTGRDGIGFLKTIYFAAIDDLNNPAYLTAFPNIKNGWRVCLSWSIAEQMWRYARNEEEKLETIAMWEKLDSDPAADTWGLRPLFGKRLAKVYLERMRNHGDPDSPEVQALMQKMTAMATVDSLDTDTFTSTLNTGLLLARYCRVIGRLEDARAAARGMVKIGLDLLSDDDQANDWQGFERLQSALMYYGDDDGALAAWSVLGPLEDAAWGKTAVVTETPAADGAAVEIINEKSVNGDSQPSDTTKGNDKIVPDQVKKAEWTGLVSYHCDGDCDTEWEYANDIYACKDCLDVMFDADCLRRMKDGSLGINICDPSHEFLYIPAWDVEEAKERGKDHVRYRGKVVPVSEWVAEIRKDWDLVVKSEDVVKVNGVDEKTN